MRSGQLLLALLFLTAGVALPSQRAAAQDFSRCSETVAASRLCEDQGKAYAAAAAVSASFLATGCSGTKPQNMRDGPVTITGPTALRKLLIHASSGSTFCPVDRTWPAGKDCKARAEQTGWKASGGGSGADVCHEGCRYSGSLDASSPTGITYSPNGSNCTLADAPAPEAGGGGGDDGGGGGEIGGGDGGGDGGEGGGDGGGGDGGGGGGGGGGGDGDGEGDGDGDGDGDDDDGEEGEEPGGEQPNVPSPEYEGDIPFPWLDGQMPSSSEGQWSSGLGNGSCPAPKSVSVGVGGYSASLEISFKPLCDFALLIRGIVLAVSAVVSAYIIAGVRR